MTQRQLALDVAELVVGDFLMNLRDDLVHAAHGVEADGAFVHNGLGFFHIVVAAGVAVHFLEAAEAYVTARKRRSGVAHGTHLHLILNLGALHFTKAHLAQLLVFEDIVQIAAGTFDEIHMLFLLILGVSLGNIAMEIQWDFDCKYLTKILRLCYALRVTLFFGGIP